MGGADVLAVAGDPVEHAGVSGHAGAHPAGRDGGGGNSDGVGFWREIANITVPLIWPAISTNLLFAVIGFFGASGNVLLLTEGRYNTTTLSYWLYDQVVVNDRYNVPSAMGILMTIASLPLVVICRWLSNKVETIEF